MMSAMTNDHATSAYNFSNITVTDAANGQSGKIELTVIASDGSPVPGVEVSWELSQDEEQPYTTLSANITTTDSNGVTSVEVTRLNDGMSKIVVTVGSKSQFINVLTYTLVAPTVTQAEDGIIDTYDLMGTIQVMIPFYSNVADKDKIILHWATADGVDIKTIKIFVNEDLTNLPLIIDVKRELPPECLAQQSYGVYYEASDNAHNTSFSQRLFFYIDRYIPLGSY